MLVLTVVFLQIAFFENSHSKLSCYDEDGKIADWIIVYKLPPTKYNLNDENYVYLSSNNKQTGKWNLSKQNISSNFSVISRILDPVIKSRKGIAYLVYNDAVPNEKYYNSNFGHAKGILAFDNDSGYWMIHSIPKFPNKDYYYFPNASKEHGQIFICINYNFTAINQIGEQLRYIKPQIYMNNTNSAVSKLSPLVQTLFSSKPSFINHSPWYNYVILNSKLDTKLIIFSKHAKFHKDLYSDFVAPVLKSSLLTETWMDGRGKPLPSNCSISYHIWNIKKINIFSYYKDKKKILSFNSSVDHSKWAVTNDILKPWVCVGDINRMKSQEKRGGGTLCLYSKAVWETFNSSIASIEAC